MADANAAGDRRAAPAKLYVESTLLRIAGAMFCHDAKRAAERTDEIVLTRGTADKHLTIRPDPKLGQPGPLAHKVFVAILKKHSDFGRPVPREVSFTRREIGRLIGRVSWGGRDSEQLARALHELHYTFIRAAFKQTGGRYVEHSFNVFPEIYVERREFASDPIEACTVTLAAPIVASLEEDHFVCLNHDLMAELGTIGQALYMRLFFHFANLYDGSNRAGLSFKKRYDDLCREWLGGLRVLDRASHIRAQQLGPHLDQLVAAGFLSDFAIARTRAGATSGHILTVRPGAGFFADYDRFYRPRRVGAESGRDDADRQGIAEPMKVVALFTELKTGVAAPSIATAYSKDTETAKQLLATVPFADMPAFIRYALTEAERTRFDVQTLSGLKQYLAGFIAERQRRAAVRAQQASLEALQRVEAEQQAYDRHRRTEAGRILAGLANAERAAIMAEAAQRAAKFTGSLRNHMLDHHTKAIVLERYGAKIASFEDWRGIKQAA